MAPPGPPDMALRLPPHIQKQLADMACSPPPRTRSDAPANSQYHTALAIQYRQRIQGIINANLSALIAVDDVTQDDADPSPSPLPSERHDSPSASASASASADLEDLLPPYSEDDPDVNTAACTITVKELSSVDTPTPTSSDTDHNNRFFALVTTATRDHETIPTRPHTDIITRIASRFSTSSVSPEDSDATHPAVDLNDQPAPLHRYLTFVPPKFQRAAALETKARDPCNTKHSHLPSCPRTSPSKVRRIVERFTAKKDDTALKNKRRRARQAVVCSPRAETGP